MLTSLRKELISALMSAESGIRINTDEIPDALAIIQDIAKKNEAVSLTIWDKARGAVGDFNPGQPQAQMPAALQPSQKPPEQILPLLHAFLKFKGDEGSNLLVIKNFHLIFEKAREDVPAVVQHLIEDGKATNKFLIGLMPPGTKLPPEVEPLFYNINHELPDEDELLHLLSGIANSEGAELLPRTPENDAIVKAALGLTRKQAEGAFAAAMKSEGGLTKEKIWKSKAAIVNQDQIITIENDPVTFADVGGLEGIKERLTRTLAEKPVPHPNVKPKGVLCCGLPGTGKSYIAKATGNSLGWPTVSVNPGNLMGKYVGDTEQKTRWLFQVLKALAPVIVIMDEIEKTMPKAGKEGGDSGVGSRMLGTFLTFMQDVKEKIFWFFTANDATNMDSAFKRRIDRTYYMRLPGPNQRAAIWKIYIEKYFPATINGQPNPEWLPTVPSELLEPLRAASKDSNFDYDGWRNKAVALLLANNRGMKETLLDSISNAVDDTLVDAIKKSMFSDENWTPDEIEKCCRLAALEGTPIHEIQDEIEHVFESDAAGHMALEAWAADKIIDAETGKKYHPGPQTEKTAGSNTKRSRKLSPAGALT